VPARDVAILGSRLGVFHHSDDATSQKSPVWRRGCHYRDELVDASHRQRSTHLNRQHRSFAWGAVAALGLLFTLTGGGVILAQDTTGTPGASPQAPALNPAHPAHIHSGTCTQIGEIIFPLNDLQPVSTASTPQAGGEVAAESTTVVDASLETILAEPHVINVHLSAEDIETYIACGEIAPTSGPVGTAGTPEKDAAAAATPASGQQLQMPLHELNGSGYQGQATLVDLGDGTTQVTVQLLRVQNSSTPIASPTS
jgi:hypothetical protein